MAQAYDEKWMPKGLPREVNERESVFENLNVKDKLLLDLGTGTLRFTLDALERGAKHVVAVDMLRDMLELGMHKAEKQGVKHRIDVILADVRYLPFLGEAFDAVSAIGLLNHIQNGRRLFLKEIYRVLRVKGIAAVNTWNAIPRMIAGFLGYTEKGLAVRKARSFRRDYWENYYRYSYPWEFRAFMRSTPFRKVKILGAHSTYFFPRFEMMTATRISKLSESQKRLGNLEIHLDRLLRKVSMLNQITGRFLLAVLTRN